MKQIIKELIIMGIGDWGLGLGPIPRSPIPNEVNVFKLSYSTSSCSTNLYFYIIFLICFKNDLD